jgi:2-polyprenyl-3-methyl-5-hydroxy-6-metoxy-1,4-benzoquinol methylase
MLKNAQRICPICGGCHAEVLYTQHFYLPDNMMLPTVYDIVACSKCEFVYADTPATQKEYDLFYTGMSKYEEPEIASGGGNTPWDKERLTRVATDLARYIDKSSAILDVGCANGGLLAILREQGFTNITGLDQSPACVSYIKKTHGIRAVQGGIFNKQFEDTGFMEEKFDLVILSHVLEHICDLQLAMDFISGKLKNNALLYIETPDAASYYRYPKVPFYYFDCEHINHFDLQHLQMLFEPKGYSVQWYTQKEFPVSEEMSYPAAALLLKNEGHKYSEIDLKHKDNAKMSVLKHLEQSIAEQNANNINRLADQYEEIIVWGAGQYTLRLLENSRLGDCNIIAFIDNDKGKQGMTLKDKKVYSPEFLKNTDCTVLICSSLYANEIANQIKDMGIERKILSPTEAF